MFDSVDSDHVVRIVEVCALTQRSFRIVIRSVSGVVEVLHEERIAFT